MTFLLQILILLFFPPFLLGVIQKTKAWFAGRKGAPLFQFYFDLLKFIRKGNVYSTSTSYLFRMGPIISLSCLISAGLLFPLLSSPTPFGFFGDMILFAYLLGLGRFFIILAALDTGSSFEGMGASREAAFSALIEPALILCLVILGLHNQSLSFAEALQPIPWNSFITIAPVTLCLALALGVFLLTDNSRIPVDDPTTHLELTMIHEVMVLDHSGVDLALILYGNSIKLFLTEALLAKVVFPSLGRIEAFPVLPLLLETIALSILIGIVESISARLRLSRIPQFLFGASALGIVATSLLFIRGIQ